MTQPYPRYDRKWFIRFYSRDPWPFYKASIVLTNADLFLVYDHFDRFKASAEAHRRAQ